MAETDLVDRVLKVIAAHDWNWLEDSRTGQVDGLGCGCGWATDDTADAVDRWRRHRDRAVRTAIDELTATTTGQTQP